MEFSPTSAIPKLRKHRLSFTSHRNNEPQITPPPISTAPHFDDDHDSRPLTAEKTPRETRETAESFFDLGVSVPKRENGSIENVMKRIFSAEHLDFILADHILFHRFSSFLNQYRSKLVPTLIRYLEMRKARKAVEYANAVARQIRWPTHLDWCKFSKLQASSIDIRFEEYSAKELSVLCSEALPAFVTHTLVGVITECVAKDITGQGILALQDLVGNLAEVFCLTDPSQTDNPIIFASDEFHKTTQYGTTYAINRNCRFLQGPDTDKNTVNRLAKAISYGQESHELLLNYRRDGTPFANLLMCSPLYDDKGIVRYFIGAQVDVTGLILEGLGLDSFRALLQHEEAKRSENFSTSTDPQQKNSWQEKKAKETLSKLQELSMTFSQDESDVVNKNSRQAEFDDTASIRSVAPTAKNKSRMKRYIGGEDSDSVMGVQPILTSSLPGVYKHYLLARPFPSLQIMFVSPSLRLPGILRTHLFSKLGGSNSTMAGLEAAFKDGASVTAKVLWMPKSANVREQGRPRYIRCTPLLGADERVGVWMVILVPLEETGLRAKPYGNAGVDTIIGLNGHLRGHPKPNTDELDGMFLDDMFTNGIDTTYAERRSTISEDNPRKIRSSASIPTLSDRQVEHIYSQETLQQIRHGADTPTPTRISQSRTASLSARGSSVGSDADGFVGVRSAPAMASTSQLLGALNMQPHTNASIHGNSNANVNGVYNTSGRFTGDGREARESKLNMMIGGKSAAWNEVDAEVSQMYAEHLRDRTPSISHRSRSTLSQGSSEGEYAFVEEENVEVDSPVVGRAILVADSERGDGGFTPTMPNMRRDTIEKRTFE